MALSDYDARSPERPVVEPSAVESSAFGISVGRLDYGLGTDWAAVNVAEAVADADCDLVILRFPSDRLEVMDGVAATGCPSLVADTLLYFAHDLEGPQSSARVALEPMSPADADDSDRLIDTVFAGYRNHYAANPLTRGVDIVSAYQEWTRTSLLRDDRRALRAVDPDGQAVGVCLVDCSSSSYEVLLAGIVPSRRGAGAYQEMLRSLLGWAASSGADQVVISTQAWNLAAMRAWVRTGFLPVLALTTVHVMR